MAIVAPSILSADFGHLASEVAEPIALLLPDETDAAHPGRRFGERSDHGDRGPLDLWLHGLAGQAQVGDQVESFTMLCYPRILGYAFNPLTVYFGLGHDGNVRLVVYEVSNTFKERMTYVVPVAEGEGDLIAQACDKQLYVSPFNTDRGTYSFRVRPPGQDVTIGVALRADGAPLLKAYFHATRSELTDTSLLGALARTGWMTVKVITGIHFEAARLWLKGMRPVPRPAAPRDEVAVVSPLPESSKIRA